MKLLRKTFWTLDDFELGKPLGRGRFGQVWLVREKRSKIIVALKMITKSQVTGSDNIKQLRRELEIHSNLKHENIIRMYGYFYDSERVYLIMEYAGGGELFDILRAKGKFSECESSKYIYQVARALQSMHFNSVIHRDIKPENILVGCDDKLKISDFGWSVTNRDHNRYTYCGTYEYIPPEMHRNKKHSSFVDLWCLGILCFEFLVGQTPFHTSNGNHAESSRKAVNLDYTIPSFISSSASDFIKKLLVSEPNSRMRIEDVFNHPWIKKYNS
ncbi:Aurora protein kinase [Hamiltosporidium tvaerminnensis]|uniref:Aurora kinase n=2 Tax=Hamiltosporidium TaxID=1176354 RepID=A0A4Q9L4X4_9MICR|nr:hypothetical protein LUQ84_000950 [Hamiltosporidium tvaerminnensis]TBU02609.1 Aurora protein kinase [Hamiltosporidium magnivora]TBU01026.1 Aurora protein kinase [Hamiltosporidium tvaerminnensis]TBU05559.1 Aurora protein kinase [Hamiltosporidium magnivora]TBU11634.1 Aurora protein kinase [Hamiltosporidium tvaerminnensis]